MKVKSILNIFMASVMVTSLAVQADKSGKVYEVTVTNLTRGQNFTPILAASHRSLNYPFFNAGEPASEALAALAEGGDTAPLNNVLNANPRVYQTVTTNGLLAPGESVTFQLKVRSGRDRISLVAMLVPTNDAFFSLQNLPLPRGHRRVVEYGPAYDAGTEPNDELCVNIPGPYCSGEGGSPGAGGEGFVHIHAGIHGSGDLTTADFDWRNPVVRVVITRVED